MFDVGCSKFDVQFRAVGHSIPGAHTLFQRRHLGVGCWMLDVAPFHLLSRTLSARNLVPRSS